MYLVLYFSSKTLIYSALFMASNMCILEILMFYDQSGKFNIKLLALFFAPDRALTPVQVPDRTLTSLQVTGLENNVLGH